jgi:alpha-L-rhamnosidase
MGILGNWLEDLAAEQLEEGKGGIPPLVCPLAISPNWPHIAQAVWDDATVLTPDVLYQYSSDKRLLARQFQSMQAWLDEGVDRAPDGLWHPDKWQLADWLDPNAPPEDPGNGRTDNILVANAYLVHTTLVFARLCAVLDKHDLAKKYKTDGARLKTLFQRRYITAEGNLMSSSQTGIALAVRFDLYPQSGEQRHTAASALDRLIRTARFQISTGFAGTPVICHALTQVGKPQLAYRMLLETKCPSWMYPVVSMGATTIWERWDSMLPDGRINPGQMTSFNHYALGSVADWLHGSVGGLAPLEAGWKTIRVRPVPGGNLTKAKASFDGPYGRVACEWEVIAGRTFKMAVTVPPNSSAVVTLPSELRKDYSASTEEEPSRTVGSGIHYFECNFDAGEWPPKPMVASNQPMPQDTIAG